MKTEAKHVSWCIRQLILFLLMQTIRLGPPYKSKCGERKLASFNTYSHSACFLECWTRAIIDRCHCLTLGMAQLGEKMNCMLFIWDVLHRTPSISVLRWRWRVLPIIAYKGRVYPKTLGVLNVAQKGFLFCQNCIQQGNGLDVGGGASSYKTL